MKRPKRIALEILGPPMLGTGLLLVGWGAVALWNILTQAAPVKWDPEILVWVLVVLVYAFVLAGIPSILYTLVMEWRFSRGLNPQSWRTVGLSSTLGLLSGGAIMVVFTGARFEPGLLGFWGGMGSAVGFLLGLFIKVRSTPRRKNAEACGPAAED